MSDPAFNVACVSLSLSEEVPPTPPVPIDPRLAELPLAEMDFVVIDLETTGWSPQEGAITEVGAVRTRNGGRTGEYASLVNPGVPVPACIEELTGISDWLLARAPALYTVVAGLLRFARGSVLVAHNAPFDLGFLTAACADCDLAWPGFVVLDTVILARELLAEDEVPDHKLRTLATYFRTRTMPTHRALTDARATAEVLGSLVGRLAKRDIHTLGQLSEVPGAVVA
jgi:DNA polymerase III subunit epsilon